MNPTFSSHKLREVFEKNYLINLNYYIKCFHLVKSIANDNIGKVNKVFE